MHHGFQRQDFRIIFGIFVTPVHDDAGADHVEGHVRAIEDRRRIRDMANVKGDADVFLGIDRLTETIVLELLVVVVRRGRGKVREHAFEFEIFSSVMSWTLTHRVFPVPFAARTARTRHARVEFQMALHHGVVFFGEAD